MTVYIKKVCICKYARSDLVFVVTLLLRDSTEHLVVGIIKVYVKKDVRCVKMAYK